MTRTRRTILVIVFVLAAALLPQALFAQGYTVCADESNPQTCTVRQAEPPTVGRQFGPAARATICADDADPQSCVARSSQPSAARAHRANDYGTADVDESATAGAVGIGVPPAPARHAPGGSYGPRYAEQ